MTAPKRPPRWYRKKLREKAQAYLGGGLELEGFILEEAQRIRELSKNAYGSALLDARLACMSLIAKAIACKASVPGNSTPKISAQLQLTTAFVQGAGYTETLISEGQYIKAAAVLKQDYELLTRILELEVGAATPGKQPNVKHAPQGSQPYYGMLNEVAHPSNPGLIQDLLSQYASGAIRGLSPIPRFVATTAVAMYELHVWLCFEIARESVKLLIQLYGTTDTAVVECMQLLVQLFPLMTAAGMKDVTPPAVGG